MAARRVPVEERLERWSRRNDETGCLEWFGWADRDGYGRIKVDGRKRRATHMALAVWKGIVVPEGMMACHTCDNPTCIEPDHLYVGDNSSNTRDAFRRGRRRTSPEFLAAEGSAGNINRAKTHCPKQHPYTEDNTYRYKTNRGYARRMCITCHKMRMKERYARRLANPS